MNFHFLKILHSKSYLSTNFHGSRTISLVTKPIVKNGQSIVKNDRPVGRTIKLRNWVGTILKTFIYFYLVPQTRYQYLF